MATRNKKFTPQGIQAYYTGHALAQAIAAFVQDNFGSQLGAKARTLDICAGEGRLTAFLRDELSGLCELDMQFIEPEQAACDRLLQDFQEHMQVRLHEMSAEEYCTTYAEADSVDVVLCNPPFGQRVGRSLLGEDLRAMHLGELADFEPYFLHIASVLARRMCVFLLPASAVRRAQTLPILTHMAQEHWHLDALMELPMDAYDDAQVNTQLWVLIRDEERPVSDWPSAAQKAIEGHQVRPLFARSSPTTVTHRTNTLSGYLLRDIEPLPVPEKVKPPAYPRYSLNRAWTPEAGELDPHAVCLRPDWEPAPLALGTICRRADRMWELGIDGFVLLQGNGYADGVPASDEFEQAKRCFHFMRQGAVHTASHLLHGLKLDQLLRGFGELPSASFLHLLTSLAPKHHSAPLAADIHTLGTVRAVLTHELALLGASHDCHMLDGNLYDPDHMNPGQLATLAIDLYEQEREEPEWLSARLATPLDQLTMLHERLELRASWWPRELLAELLGLAVSKDGFFIYASVAKKLPWRQDAIALVDYLNFGKTGRLKDADRELYHEVCDQVALALIQPVHPCIPPELKRLAKLYYMAAHSPGSARTHVAPPAAKPAKPLRAWQLEDRARLLRGSQILNWDVGLGKTLGALFAAASHPGQSLIVVPRSVLSKWMREAKEFFPQASIGLLGFRTKRDGTLVTDLSTLAEDAATLFYKERKQLVFTSHEVFSRLKIPRDVQQAADELDARAVVGTSFQRSVIKRREGFIQRAANKNFRMGSALTFSDLPLASLFVVVDEAHRFKGLFPMPSGGWGSRLVMAGGCAESKRSRDMKIKFDMLRRAGGKTLALTATPVLNSVAEIFNMLRVFAPDQLERLGIANVQQLIDTFCSMEEIIAVGPTGKIVEGQTIKGFRQIPLLKNLWQRCMITRTAVDVGLELPEAREEAIQIEATPQIRDFLDQCKSELNESMELQKAGKTATGEEHIFSILSRMDSVAAHPPLVGIHDEHPKAQALLDKLMEHYRAGGNQIVFLDRKEAHQAIKQRMVAAGIPEHEIVILNGDETPDLTSRIQAQDDYNCGKVRVAIGGQVASEGMDLQHNTVAIHFLNLPWEGQTVHQRKGRGVRQGNKVEAVCIYYYLLECSTDVYRRSLISKKSHWWESLRTCQTDNMVVSLVASPVEDGLLVSLAKDPDAMRAMLAQKRLHATLWLSTQRATRLVSKLVRAMNPDARASCLPIIRRHERTLRSLEGITPEVADSVMERADTIAHILHSAATKRHDQLKASPGYHRTKLPTWDYILMDMAGMRDRFTPTERQAMVELHWFMKKAEPDSELIPCVEFRAALSPKMTLHIQSGFVPLRSVFGQAHRPDAITLSRAELDELDGLHELGDEHAALVDEPLPCVEDIDLIFEELPASATNHVRESAPAATERSAQGELLSLPRLKTAPAPTPPKRTRTTPERVYDLLNQHNREEVAQALAQTNSIRLIKWLRGEIKGVAARELARSILLNLDHAEQRFLNTLRSAG